MPAPPPEPPSELEPEPEAEEEPEPEPSVAALLEVSEEAPQQPPSPPPMRRPVKVEKGPPAATADELSAGSGIEAEAGRCYMLDVLVECTF